MVLRFPKGTPLKKEDCTSSQNEPGSFVGHIGSSHPQTPPEEESHGDRNEVEIFVARQEQSEARGNEQPHDEQPEGYDDKSDEQHRCQRD